MPSAVRRANGPVTSSTCRSGKRNGDVWGGDRFQLVERIVTRSRGPALTPAKDSLSPRLPKTDARALTAFSDRDAHIWLIAQDGLKIEPHPRPRGPRFSLCPHGGFGPSRG